MHIEKIRVDRFGTCSHLEIDSFTDGLNVFFGPAALVQKTLLHFVRAMLHGFQPDVRRQFLSAGPHVFGGSVTVRGTAGRSFISRHDDGSIEGQLSVQHADGRVLAPHDLSEVLPRVSAEAFEKIHAVDYESRPALSALFQEVQRLGIDLRARSPEAVRLEQLQDALRSHREQLQNLPPAGLSVEALRQRCRTLSEEIEALKSQAAADLAQTRQRRTALVAEMSEAQRQLDLLRRELDEVRRGLADCEARRAEWRPAAAPVPAPGSNWQQRLQELDSQLERWRLVHRDIVQRRQAIQAESQNQAVKCVPAAQRVGDPRHHLRGLEEQLGALDALSRGIESAVCRCEQLRGALPAKVQGMRESLYRLCRDLNSWEAGAQLRDNTGELAQLLRCEAELESAIESLCARRLELLQKTAAVHPSGALPPWEEAWCGCHEHPPYDRFRVESAPHASPFERPLRDEAIERLARREEKLLRDIDEWEVELAELRDRLGALDLQLAHAGERDVEAKRGELHLREVEWRQAEIRDEIRRAMAVIEQEIEHLRSRGAEANLIQQAANLLRRMSAGNLVGLHLDASDLLTVVDEYGGQPAFESLSEGQRNLVYLSLCLTLVADLKRRGVGLPMLVTGLFSHLDSKLVPETAEVLRDFAAQGHQVVVLTRFEHVASCFRLLNVQVRRLDAAIGRSSDTLSERQWEPLATRGSLDDAREHDRRPWDGRPWDGRPWDAEEFPGELTDRVRLDQQPAPRPREVASAAPTSPFASAAPPCDSDQPVSQSDSAPARYHLTESHLIEHAPSIDRANIDRLRKIGILRVGDLLRVSPVAVAAELRYAGITSEMIANWQAQARLVCQVPDLRPYDARILVACGITTPEALRSLPPRKLRHIVRDFATSSEGQAVLLSGTEYELSRVTDWIKAARRELEEADRDRGAAQRPQSVGRTQSTPTPAPEATPQPPSDAVFDSSLGRSASRRASRRTASGADQRDDRILKLPTRSDWQFYLDRSAPIVDAPSIGDRTARQLETLGITTVDDFLRADPAELARQLGNRRISAALLRQWQQQTVLACRIPQLRGHDAQLLVAVGITEPEQLVRSDPQELLGKVTALVQTKDGKRILRNGKEPDLAEIQDWIEWSAAARALHAA